MKKVIYFFALLSVMTTLFCVSIAYADDSSSFSDNPKAIQTASESVILIECYDNMGQLYATGSAFCLFENGVFVTNYHVISENTYSIKGRMETGLEFSFTSVIAYSEKNDVAILRTNAKTGLNTLSVGNSLKMEKGEKVVAIGSPRGLINTVSVGVYSGRVQNEREFLQFSASISHGSSGGALFNNNGEVVGITSNTLEDGQNLNFAVPIEIAEELWESRETSNEMTISQFNERNTIESPISEGKDSKEESEILGVKENNTYASEFLGIMAGFSEEYWYVLSNEETVEAMGYVADSLGNDDLAEQLRNSGTVCDLYVLSLDNSGDNINIQLENLGFLYGLAMSEEAYYKAAVPQLEEAFAQMGLTNVTVKQEKIEFAGSEHVSCLISGEYNGTMIYERMAMVKAGNYMATVTAFSFDRDSVDAMIDMFEAYDAEALAA